MAFNDRRPINQAILYDNDTENAVTVREEGGEYRLQISGPVSVTAAAPPPNTTPVAFVADTPLTVGDDTQAYVIPNGELLHLQSLICGNEDPTKGATVELIWFDGTEHTIARVFLAGFTQLYGFADITQARDGTVLLGNGTNELRVRRAKFSGTNIAIDAVVRGYTTT